MNLLPNALPAPRPEVMIDRAPWWEIVRQQFPGAAAADGVVNPIDDLAAGMFGRTAARFGSGHQRLQVLPFCIREIGIVWLAALHSHSVTARGFSNALLDASKRGSFVMMT